MVFNKYILIVILSIIFQFQVFSEGYWEKINSPVRHTLYKSSFIDSLTGWAAGDSGKVIYTSNGGNSWIVYHTPVKLFIEDIYFIDHNSGWAVANNYFGLGTVILNTTNGGVTWDTTNIVDSLMNLFNISFINTNTGIVSGTFGTFLKTTNSGLTWIQQNIDSISNFSMLPSRELIYVTPDKLIACGGLFDYSGVMWVSTNGGNYWIDQPVGGEPIFDIVKISESVIVGIGGDLEFGGAFVKSTNGGLNWNYNFMSMSGIGEAIAVRKPDDIWISLGFIQKLLYTKDTGKTWILSPQSFDSSIVYDIVFTDSSHGFAFGTNGLILKYVNSPIGIENDIKIYPEDFILYQNYPNPFNPYTTIEYYISKPAETSLILYDAAGREVTILVNKYHLPGKNKISFNSEGLSSGIYFYVLRTGEQKFTRKLSIIK